MKVEIILMNGLFDYYKQANLAMRIIGAIKNVIYNSDLMNSGSLLRVKGDPTHNTLLGGIVSISLMLVLAALFWNKIIDTMDKKIITSSAATTNADDPLPLNLTTLDSGPFMFGVEVWHHDLNTGSRLFDIVLTNTQYNYGLPGNGTISMALEPCTRSHWDGFPTIQQKFDQLFIGYWKCLPKNRSFEIMGKYSSVKSRTLDVSVKKCTNNSLQSRPCAPQAEIDQYFVDNGIQFFTIYFLNPLINPDSADYLKYYLQDSNYITFTATSGEESRLFVQDYQIATDQSIFPMSDILVETGGIITGNPLKSTYVQISDTYAVFFFFKSPVSLAYDRTFQKLDEVFAYIGGLFGTIIIAFFLMSSYNAYKYEINLAGYLYRNEQGGDKIEKDYNFFYYLGQLLYTVLRALCCEPKWERLCYYYETRQEMLKQIDILYLLKRINFLENSLNFLFTNHQIKGLHLTSHISLAEAVKLRKIYRLKAKLSNQLRSSKKDSNESFMQQQNFIESKEEIFNIKNAMHRSSTKGQKQMKQLDNQFDSDCYSSDKSSDEDDVPDTCVLDSVKALSSQQHSNPLSQKILKNIDKRLKLIIQPPLFSKSFQREIKSNEEYEQFTENNMQSNAVNKIHNDFTNLQQGNEEKDLVQEESQFSMSKTFAKTMFAKIQAVQIEPQKQED